MYCVIGIEVVDYINKSNKRVSGLKFHCTYDKDGVSGNCVDNFYISADKLDVTVELGDYVEPLYNKFGNVQAIQIMRKE